MNRRLFSYAGTRILPPGRLSSYFICSSPTLPSSTTRCRLQKPMAAFRWVTTKQVFSDSDDIFSSTRSSVWSSRALVASSNNRIGASLRRALAIAIRCTWPSDRPKPLSPTSVHSPSGRVSTKSSTQDNLIARIICSSVIFSLRNAMLSQSVPEKIHFPWGTQANKDRVPSSSFCREPSANTISIFPASAS